MGKLRANGQTGPNTIGPSFVVHLAVYQTLAVTLPLPMATPDASPDEADFENQLTRMIADLPPTLLHNLHILLTGCTQGALSLWREPGVAPEVIAEAEALTRLTEERVREMSQLRLPEELGRLLLTAPVRLHDTPRTSDVAPATAGGGAPRSPSRAGAVAGGGSGSAPSGGKRKRKR